jgi:hypothetical protein
MRDELMRISPREKRYDGDDTVRRMFHYFEVHPELIELRCFLDQSGPL